MPTRQKVYIVTSQFSYEDYTIHRVFATEEDALKFLEDARLGSFHKSGYEVEEYDIE